ncbi:protein kinase [soil metagenome]
MTRECTECRRSTPGDEAVFCMFCGHRLAKSTVNVEVTIDHVSSAIGLAAETVTDSAPSRVGGYRIVRRLGEGGMGSVYEAEPDDGSKNVALKLLSPKLAANPVSVERFRQEGRLASQISHPRCVFVYRADADAGRPFIVMELMPGLTLKDLIDRSGRLSPGDAVRRILDVVDGLIEAHRLGLIHRDVKPSNCFITADDRVKVGDFGLSKSLTDTEQDGQLTSTGAFLGTVLYAPPEQIRGEEVRYDSDVYSVCATLYFLLTARAPYQHESVTAALARAISEPPPRVRDLRPDVPNVLDQLIRKGLERDRSRRFATLEELRDALLQLQPEEQLPARTRMLMAAYLIDVLLTFFLVQIPVEFVEWLFGVRRSMNIGFESALDPVSTIGFVLYFALLEGFWGATVGKWLLGLRVVPFGSVGPPGFGVATLRTTVFHFGWMLIYLADVCINEIPSYGILFGLPLLFGGIAFLAYRKRKLSTNRGLHDLATNTHVVQMPRSPHRVRLASRFANRLDQLRPIPNPPRLQGGTILRGELVAYASKTKLWIAEDRSLGRRILVRITPEINEPPLPPMRFTRLRFVSSGTCDWQGHPWHWQGFAAPAGAPLGDMIDPAHPLNWADSRLILEELVEELIAMESDTDPLPRLGVDQLWSEPGGRIYLLEFPLRTSLPEAESESPMDLVRETATLLLEGTPRSSGEPVRAPLPPHASAITNRLFDFETPYATLSDLQCDLAGSHDHAPTVTTAMRTAHLGVTAMLIAIGLAGMLLATLLNGFWYTLWTDLERSHTNTVLQGLDKPAVLEKWQSFTTLESALKPELIPKLKERLQTQKLQHQEQFDQEFANLTKLERFVMVRLRPILETTDDELLKMDPNIIRSVTRTPEPTIEVNKVDWRKLIMKFAVVICGGIVLAFTTFAFAFRGGLAYVLSGIALVRRDGRPAGRFRCALREALIWLPLLVILFATAYVQAEWPGWFLGRMILCGCTVAVLIGYAAVGFRYPEQGPHDRLTGTFRVPV